ncbi:hypothetical protein [Agriterribacter sp.]|uniref:hypothetical protein n=1 Tax=Agriterribacter sp. TaxID=2821509 RepID=UPI002CA74CDA|nr:hypothetical protein [Agriterribacter sp.]HRP58208.1 hypothetical protein [Agriterribacter sp.]
MKEIPQTRFAKLKFLNDLKSGKISIADITGDNFTVWINESDSYTNDKTKDVLTRLQFEAQTATGTHIILIPLRDANLLKIENTTW